MTSYDITQLQLQDGGAGNGVQTNILFRINSKPGLSNGDEVTFGMTSENFSNDSFQLSDGQTLTIGNVSELATQTEFTLASSGTVFAANSAGSGQIQGYTGGSYSSGDFTITTSGGGGSSGGFTIRGSGSYVVRLNGQLKIS